MSGARNVPVINGGQMLSHLSWKETFYQVSQYQSGGTPGSDFGREENLY